MRFDRRVQTLCMVFLAVVVLAGVLELIPSRGIEIDSFQPPVSEATVVPAPAAQADTPGREQELARHFNSAVVMLHAKQYEHALVALHQVLRLAPGLPEAHVNRGFALLGLERPELAEQAFKRAIDLKAEQVNAYYGWAVAAEEQDDREAALGAMRTFVHLADPGDPFVRKARAALWEWQSESVPEQPVERPLAETASLASQDSALRE